MKQHKSSSILFFILILSLSIIPVSYAENRVPEPYFISPRNAYDIQSDIITITDQIVTIEAIDLSGENDIVSATFEFQQEEYHWIYLGFDDDNLLPSIQFQGNETTNRLGGTSWVSTWDLGIFGEGSYILRVVFTDSTGKTGSNTLQVYYDPNPPQTDFNYKLETTKISGNHSLKLTNSGNNLQVLNISSHDLPYPEIFHLGVGYADQVTMGVTSSNGGPIAAANALWNLDILTSSSTEIAQELAVLCRTDPDNGTATHDLTTGILNYLYTKGLSQDYCLESFVSTVNDDGSISNKPKWSQYWTECKKDASLIVFLSHPGSDGIPATSDDITRYYTGLGGNLDTGEIFLLNPDDASVLSGFVNPPSNLGGFESVWVDENMNGEMTDDELLYLFGLWSIEPRDNNWTLICQDTNSVNGLSAYWDTTLVQDGFYYLKTSVRDLRDLRVSSYGTFYVNNHLPTAAELMTPTLVDIGQTKLVLRWSSCEDNDFNRYEIYVNGTLKQSITDKTTNSSMVSGLLPDTMYEITLRTIDYTETYVDSSVYSETKPIESGFDDIDDESPEVNIISTIGDIIQVNTIDIEWSVNEPVETTTYTLDNMTPVEITGTSIRLTGLEEGTHTFALTVVDYSGHSGEDEISFIVDTLPPIIDTPNWSVIVTEDRYLINIGVNVEDATSTITSVTCITTELTSTTNRIMTQNDSTYTCSFLTAVSNLPLTFTIKATDAAGNTIIENNDQQSYIIEYEEVKEEPSQINTILIAGLAIVTIIAIILIINIVRRTRV